MDLTSGSLPVNSTRLITPIEIVNEIHFPLRNDLNSWLLQVAIKKIPFQLQFSQYITRIQLIEYQIAYGTSIPLRYNKYVSLVIR